MDVGIDFCLNKKIFFSSKYLCDIVNGGTLKKRHDFVLSEINNNLVLVFHKIDSCLFVRTADIFKASEANQLNHFKNFY